MPRRSRVNASIAKKPASDRQKRPKDAKKVGGKKKTGGTKTGVGKTLSAYGNSKSSSRKKGARKGEPLKNIKLKASWHS